MSKEERAKGEEGKGSGREGKPFGERRLRTSTVGTGIKHFQAPMQASQAKQNTKAVVKLRNARWA